MRCFMRFLPIPTASTQLRRPHRPGRMFWPREVWGRYAERLDAFKQPAQRRAAVRCLNALVANALAHAPHCLAYLAQLRDPAVFRFCAIPQARGPTPSKELVLGVLMAACPALHCMRAAG